MRVIRIDTVRTAGDAARVRVARMRAERGPLGGLAVLLGLAIGLLVVLPLLLLFLVLVFVLALVAAVVGGILRLLGVGPRLARAKDPTVDDRRENVRVIRPGEGHGRDDARRGPR